jgi:arylsulfatase A-like enzyme
MTDQWRGDCLGLAGHPIVETPHLDSFFSTGVVFRQAYSAAPTCIAARAALLTGLSQKSHGRVGYQDKVIWDYPITLPGLLSQAGYHTHCVGKMHVYPARNLMGFHSVDLHDGYLHVERREAANYGLSDDYLPYLINKYGSDVDITDAGLGCNGYSVNPWPYEERYHPTNWVTTKSIDFFRRRDTTKPFFLKVSYHRPHPPLDPPRFYLDRYMNKELPPVHMGDWVKHSLPTHRGPDSPVPTSESQIDLARKAYYAQITHIDNQINRLVHALGEYKLLGNTLVMFISDHGEMLYDHNMVAKGVGFDASARIPFLLKFPYRWEQPEVRSVDQPVELRDVLPTFLDAAGLDIPKSIEGQSVLPLCHEKNQTWREYIHGEHNIGLLSQHWITNGQEMYVWFSQSGEEMYFDLTNDPHNLRNSINENENRVADLRENLVQELEGREEGYVKNGQLVIGRRPKSVLNHIQEKLPASSV